MLTDEQIISNCLGQPGFMEESFKTLNLADEEEDVELEEDIEQEHNYNWSTTIEIDTLQRALALVEYYAKEPNIIVKVIFKKSYVPC